MPTSSQVQVFRNSGAVKMVGQSERFLGTVLYSRRRYLSDQIGAAQESNLSHYLSNCSTGSRGV
jgi:hypothetical protein